MERKTSINVAHNIIGKYYVSTAMWATFIIAAGGFCPTYETFIWEWDSVKKERGKILKQYYHRNRRAGIQFHFRYCRLLAWRKLKQEMPTDTPFLIMEKEQ